MRKLNCSAKAKDSTYQLTYIYTEISVSVWSRETNTGDTSETYIVKILALHGIYSDVSQSGDIDCL